MTRHPIKSVNNEKGQEAIGLGCDALSKGSGGGGHPTRSIQMEKSGGNKRLPQHMIPIAPHYLQSITYVWREERE